MEIFIMFSKSFSPVSKLRTDYKFLIKPTLILSALYLVALSALFRANHSYIDDVYRELWGMSGWGFSRYIPNILSVFVHADRYLSDISPLTQVLAVFIISLTGIISIHLITGEKHISIWHLIAAIPIALSPYFLQCLSYKYDSPYMALSVLFGVLPLLTRKSHWAKYALSIAVCTVLMASAYQASSGISPMLVIIIGLQDWLKGEKLSDVLKFYGLSAAAYLAGLIFYNTFLVADYDAYASTALAPLAELIPCAIANYKMYADLMLSTFDIKWLLASGAIGICFMVTAVYNSRQNRLLSAVLVILATIAMALVSLGVYPFLLNPLNAPRAMYGIGCLIAFWGIYAISHPVKWNPTKFFCFVLSWMFFVFCFTYGNALDVQADYTDFRIQAAIDDLDQCSALQSAEPLDLKITGSIGYAPAVDNLAKEFPMVEELILVMFEEDYFGEFSLKEHYGLPAFTYRVPTDEELANLPMIAESYYHTIYANDRIIWIDLH